MTSISKAVLALACILALAPCGTQAGELTLSAQTRVGLLHILIRYDDGREAWGQYIAQETPPFIAALEHYMGKPFPRRGSLVINGCDGCQSRLDASQEIYLDYVYSTVGNPSVLFHELAHYYFGFQGAPICQEWLFEGLCSFLPVAMREKGLLTDTPAHHEEILRNWGLWWTPPAEPPDVPLCPFNEGMRNRLYAKSFKLQYLTYLKLGPRRYQSFARALYKQQPRRNRQVVHLLSSFKRSNWRAFLSGWVFGGVYKRIAMGDLVIDGDSDGLTRAEEEARGLSDAVYDSDYDLLPDGAEIRLGRSPRHPDSDALELIARHGPFIDGSDGEWGLFSFQTAYDPSADQNGPAWADMSELRYFIRDGSLYLLVVTGESPPALSEVFFDAVVDYNFDGQVDVEFAFRLNEPRTPWKYSSAMQAATFPAGLQAARGRYLEMRIPLDQIPAPAFRIWPIIRDEQAALNFDQWIDWVVIAP